MSVLAMGLLLQLQAARTPSPVRRVSTGCESIVFSAKVCCVGQGPDEGVRLTLTDDPGAEPSLPLHTYTIRLSRLEHGVQTTSYEKKLGEGGWCHVLFRGLDSDDDRPKAAEVGRRGIIFVWIEGQKSSAYVFRILNENLIPLFEKAEGRGRFTCRATGRDDAYEVIEEDSAWHLRSYPLPESMLRKLRGVPAGRLIYKLRGARYVLSDLEPVAGRPTR